MYFSYILSVCVMFVVLGFCFNFYCSLKKVENNKHIEYWIFVAIAALFFPVTIVITVLGLVVYGFKIITDSISKTILGKINRKKEM